MNVVFTISEHSKRVLEGSKYTYQAPNGAQGTLEITKPIEVLHNCINTKAFGRKAPMDNELIEKLNTIPEEFCFVFVGHWLRGAFGEDRKNVAHLVKLFLETFRQVETKTPPALILKTSSAGFSILDREEILTKIAQIKKSVVLEPGQIMPNIYLLHGELTECEMNTLYNHPKAKSHISFTKGEGFGRPLLEASVSGRPIIASGWSGHLDFLDKDRALLIGGELKQVHSSVVWEDIILKDSHWFAIDSSQAMNAMATLFLDYNRFKKKAEELALINRSKFSYEVIRLNTHKLLDQYIPEFSQQVPVALPKLKKVELPKLKKVE